MAAAAIGCPFWLSASAFRRVQGEKKSGWHLVKGSVCSTLPYVLSGAESRNRSLKLVFRVIEVIARPDSDDSRRSSRVYAWYLARSNYVCLGQRSFAIRTSSSHNIYTAPSCAFIVVLPGIHRICFTDLSVTVRFALRSGSGGRKRRSSMMKSRS